MLDSSNLRACVLGIPQGPLRGKQENAGVAVKAPTFSFGFSAFRLKLLLHEEPSMNESQIPKPSNIVDSNRPVNLQIFSAPSARLYTQRLAQQSAKNRSQLQLRPAG